MEKRPIPLKNSTLAIWPSLFNTGIKIHTMKKIIVSLSLLMFALVGQSQDYRWAIGIRAGSPQGITFKKSLGGSNAFEGILDFRSNGFLATGLFETHKPFLSEPGLSWFYGAGAHFGTWSDNALFFNGNDNGYVIGADGILGIEYTFQSLPFNIGIDWKPAFNIAENPGLYMSSGAISLRFAI